jgi:hypothetical protein
MSFVLDLSNQKNIFLFRFIVTFVRKLPSVKWIYYLYFHSFLSFFSWKWSFVSVTNTDLDVKLVVGRLEIFIWVSNFNYLWFICKIMCDLSVSWTKSFQYKVSLNNISLVYPTVQLGKISTLYFTGYCSTWVRNKSLKCLSGIPVLTIFVFYTQLFLTYSLWRRVHVDFPVIVEPRLKGIQSSGCDNMIW